MLGIVEMLRVALDADRFADVEFEHFSAGVTIAGHESI